MTHSIEIRIVRGGTVEELAPQQLTVQRQRWCGVLDFLVQICGQRNSIKSQALLGSRTFLTGQLMVEQSGAQAAETQIRRKSDLTGHQRLGRHFGLVERGHPGLALQMAFKADQRFGLAANPDGRH